MTSPVPSNDVRARVLEGVRRAPAPPRAVGRRRRAAAIALGFSLLLAIALKLGAHAGFRPVASVFGLDATWLGVAILATWAGVSRGRSMLGRSASWRLVVAVLTPLGLLASWVAVQSVWPDAPTEIANPGEDARCVWVTFAFAAGPLAAFVYARRAADPIAPALGGAALGAAAGAWAAVALVVVCRFANPRHMLLAHVIPVAVMALVGTVIGARVLAIPTRTG